MNIVVIGEILWDVFADSERLGGAPFNFAVHARRLGHEVMFVSAVGDDDRGRRALERAARYGLPTDFIRVAPDMATGAVTVFLDAAGQPDFTIHRPAAYDALRLDAGQLGRIASAKPGWIYYGTLLQTDPNAYRVTLDLLRALPRARRFYDINLRRDSYTPELVRTLMAAADAVKLNDEEAALFPEYSACSITAVTRGERGCALRIRGDYAECPACPVTVVDTVGAGDAFAAAFLHGLDQGWSAAKTGDFANRLAASIAAQRGAVPEAQATPG
ncbi:MAG: PfkB family carbohydrate kinase [Bryobacteraceae bacterium]